MLVYSPTKRRERVAIIGGGIAGMVAARTLAKHSNADVVVLERARRLGGLAGSFEVEPGVEIEKYYHFICKPDTTYFRLMKELGIHDRLRWVNSDMGLYHNGSLSSLGDPMSLVRFKGLGWIDKYRFVRAAARVKRAPQDGWRHLENRLASEWLIEEYGRRTYEMLYEPLMRLKFREHNSSISAAWVWARHHRISHSRSITQKERIGYLEGGSQLFIDRLEDDLRRRGVEIRTGAVVEGLEFTRDRIDGVRVAGKVVHCDHLISTAPTPYLLPLIEPLRGLYWDNLRALEHVGVVVILLRLKRSLSRHFWMNVSDPRIDLAGIIEYTNLNPCPQLGGDSIVYLPQYVESSHPLFGAPDDELLQNHIDYLKIINPEFDQSWIVQHWIHRDRFSQPICRVGFVSQIPAMQTAVENMYLTDSHQLHPHDRAISASSDLGERAASLVMEKIQLRRGQRARA